MASITALVPIPGLILDFHNFWPLLTSVNGLTKSRPETLTCANHKILKGRICALSPEEPAEYPLFLEHFLEVPKE